MGSANELLKGNMDWIGRLMQQGGMRHWCTLAAFVAFFLVALYWLLLRRPATRL